MIANNSQNISSDYNPFYTIDFVQNLQVEMGRKVSKEVNKYRASEKNDLGVKIKREQIENLYTYYNILEQIKYCNSCFEGMNIEEIVGKIKNKINE